MLRLSIKLPNNRIPPVIFQKYVQFNIRDVVVSCFYLVLIRVILRETRHFIVYFYTLGCRYDVKIGATVGTDDYYEERGRTNGAICDHNKDDKLEFLSKFADPGAISMDLGSNVSQVEC